MNTSSKSKSSSKPESKKSGSSKVVIKEDFYFDQIKKYILLVFSSVLILSFLIYSVLTLYWEQPKDKYFAGYRDGSIIQEIPLDQKFYFNGEVTSWAALIMMDLLSFDFLNYAENIKRQSQSFTTIGLTKFIGWFRKELLANMVENRFVLSTHLCGVVEVLREGLNEDKIYSWGISMPLVFTFQNSGKREVLTAIAKLNLVRVASTDSFSGVHVNEVFFEKLESSQTKNGSNNCPTSPNYS